jgi:hypothetical protein
MELWRLAQFEEAARIFDRKLWLKHPTIRACVS